MFSALVLAGTNSAFRSFYAFIGVVAAAAFHANLFSPLSQYI